MLLWTLGNMYLFILVISFSSDIYSVVELLPMVVLFWNFWKMPVLFSIVAVPVYAPTISACGFSFLHIFPTLVISCLFDNSHSDRYAVISHCSLDLHFPGDQCYWASFHVPIDHLYVLLGKMSIQDLCPFKKNWVVHLTLWKKSWRNPKTVYWLGEDICQEYVQWGINIQNTWRTCIS